MGARGIALIAAVALLVPTSAAADPTPPEPTAPVTAESTTETPAPPAATGPTPAPSTSTPTPTPAPTPTVPPKAAPKYVERTVVLGTTAKGRKIVAYYKGYDIPGARTLVVLGQMHGNEKAGLQTVDWLRKWVRPTRYAEMWLIPTMNPDGNAKSTRRNSRGVDLNRNWPTSGWSSKGKGSGTWGGSSKGSERETKAMMAFLTKVKPEYVVSLHQPFGVVAKNNKNAGFEKRLSSFLGLKRRAVGVGTAKGKTSPTLTGWYNRYHRGTAVTVEYKKKVKKSWSREHAGRAIARAAGIR